MNKKVLKVIKTIVVAIIIISLLLSVFASLQHHHLSTCETEHCHICCIIKIAQNMVGIMIAACICVYACFLIYFCLARMREKIQFTRKTSLIFQKVQFNE